VVDGFSNAVWGIAGLSNARALVKIGGMASQTPCWARWLVDVVILSSLSPHKFQRFTQLADVESKQGQFGMIPRTLSEPN
jgi:hypothetical protein